MRTDRTWPDFLSTATATGPAPVAPQVTYYQCATSITRQRSTHITAHIPPLLDDFGGEAAGAPASVRRSSEHEERKSTRFAHTSDSVFLIDSGCPRCAAFARSAVRSRCGRFRLQCAPSPAGTCPHGTRMRNRRDAAWEATHSTAVRSLAWARLWPRCALYPTQHGIAYTCAVLGRTRIRTASGGGRLCHRSNHRAPCAP